MKRDMELIRKILAQIKARDTLGYRPIEIPDTDPAIVARHVELLQVAPPRTECGLSCQSRTYMYGSQQTSPYNSGHFAGSGRYPMRDGMR